MKNKFKNIKQPGFKVPDGYFDNLKIDQKDLELPEGNGFKVPDAYFDELTDRLAKTQPFPEESGFKAPGRYLDAFTPEIPEKEVKVIDLFKRNALKIAGLVAAASLILFMFTNTPATQTEPVDFDTLSANEIETWLLENPNSINSDELAENLIENNTLEADLFSDEELTEYLLNTDIETLITEN